MPDLPTTYRDAGVDIGAMNLAVQRMRESVRTTFTAGVLTDLGSFGGVFRPDFSAYDDPVLVSSIDGVGTKVKVAAMARRYDTIGADLVNHCVNDILVQGAAPLFFMDYFATARLDPDVAVAVISGLAEACRANGCALLGGETAEMPGVYAPDEFDVAGCIVGIADRANLVDGSGIEPGDAVVGLASSGLHTNGYSLARHVLLEEGGLSLDETPAALGGLTLGEALLAPHRCYAPAVLPLVSERRVKGMAHITGGGFYDNVPRTLPADCSVTLDRRTWTVPGIFALIQDMGNVPDPEMHRAFNMGIGMVLIVERSGAAEVMAALQVAGETPSLIGEVYRGVHEVDIL
ncbi:MAG TPA: phosphoribosylformylglycinamidine cyclo-ligase [Chthonomonadales bacterium]|nr:phosphoribosylformylglycinamidine cyclo-ligase [Chthonomonadales bacterium]